MFDKLKNNKSLPWQKFIEEFFTLLFLFKEGRSFLLNKYLKIICVLL